ncbi:TnsA endonuclease N-terminal domain-containing protein [Photobacterium profundum]|uniref:TnsA endonuclease N-terminal domain-containing protein n=1 Tax=Photobacterium profundum (strain SS9) TaxID=298386 RepID=Q6LRP6_PHOPR|nr:TnsA endonuclease N-terminal domain-containing protein [Photobacterium profundum]CAG20030.1 hypothetical protein PBPRA1619 [Photobacterium profundum SS9]
MFEQNHLSRRLYRSSRVKTAISYSSSKHPFPQFCESVLEKERCLERDFNPKIETYQTQPFTILVNGIRYTPDAITREVDGTDYVEEVKPLVELEKPKVIKRLREIERGLREKGIRFRILTDELTSNRTYIANLWLLKRHQSYPHNLEWLSEAKKEFGTASTIGQVTRWLCQKGVNVGALYHAIGLQEVSCDLKAILKPQTEVLFA